MPPLYALSPITRIISFNQHHFPFSHFIKRHNAQPYLGLVQSAFGITMSSLGSSGMKVATSIKSNKITPAHQSGYLHLTSLEKGNINSASCGSRAHDPRIAEGGRPSPHRECVNRFQPSGGNPGMIDLENCNHFLLLTRF